MRIAAHMLEEMIAHTREETPNECCGMVAARGDQLVAVHRAVNTEASPLRFVIDARQQLQIMDEIDSAGLELGAIYHSHTRTPPRPSQTDINFARGWPGVLWIIIGLDHDAVTVQTWQIDEGAISEVELDVG